MNQLVHKFGVLAAFYKKNSDKLDWIFKFLGGLIIFLMLSTLANGNMSIIKILGITLIGGVISMFASAGVFLCLMGAIGCLYIAFFSLEAAILAFVIYSIFFVFYIRIFPKESIFIPIMLGAYFLKIPYVIPILLAIYFGIKGIGIIFISGFIYHNLGVIEKIADAIPKTEFSVMNLVDNIIKALDVTIKTADLSWILPTGILMVGLITAWLVNKLFINNETDYAIIISGVVMLIAFILTAVLKKADVSIIGTVIGIPISCLIAYFIKSVDFVLDYRNAEKVKFQDDRYVYYVKAVPKIKV